MAATVTASVQADNNGGGGQELTSGNITPSGSNRCIWVLVGNSTGGTTDDPDIVRYGGSGGTDMTLVSGPHACSSAGRASLYRLIAPAASANTIYAHWGTAQDETWIIAVATQDTDQTTPNGTIANATGTNTAITVNAASVSGDLVLDFASFVDFNGNSRSLTVGANQTSLQEIEAGAIDPYAGAGASSESATGTSTTMSWTISGTLSGGAWRTMAFAVNAASAGTTHTTTGSLSAQAASVAGSATHLTLHTTTGALSAQAAAVAGSATHLTLHTTTGDLAADAATVSGTAVHPHTTTGALAAQDAAVAGSSAHLTLHTTTGSLASQDAAVAGSATRSDATGSHSTTGSLSAQDATVAGSATHLTLHTTTGALAADAATVAGSAAHLTVHTTTGSLEAQSATISGTAQNGEVEEPTGLGGYASWSSKGKKKPRSEDYVAPKQTADQVKAERIKLGIIQPDVEVVAPQQEVPTVAEKQQIEQLVAEKQQVSDKIQAQREIAESVKTEVSQEIAWELHVYEQLLARQIELAQAEADRKAKEADIVFVTMALMALQ